MKKIIKPLLLLLLSAPALCFAHSDNHEAQEEEVDCENHLASAFPELLKPFARLECDQFIVNPADWQWRYPNSYFDRPYIPAFAPKPKKQVAGMRLFRQLDAEEVSSAQIPELHEHKFGKIRSYKQAQPPKRLIRLKATNDLGDSMDVWFGLLTDDRGWVSICAPVCAPEYLFLIERLKP
jgi:hypothetical protein